MRHLKNTCKLGRTSSHRRCMFANILKSLILNGQIETTVAKAKFTRPLADKMITLAKENSLASRRRATAELMIAYNSLTEQERRGARKGDLKGYNEDRKVLGVLFGELRERFAGRNGGYTRIVRKGNRVGDNAPTCILAYLQD